MFPAFLKFFMCSLFFHYLIFFPGDVVTATFPLTGEKQWQVELAWTGIYIAEARIVVVTLYMKIFTSAIQPSHFSK